MKWPLPQDFNEAVQNPAVTFADPDLAAGETVVGPHGLPLPHSGNFADVYQVRGADGVHWAVKCFTRPVFGLNVRYARLAEELDQANFRFTVGFTFLADGIRVRGEWRPIIKMEWIEGRPLNQVVGDNTDNAKVLGALAHRWMKLCRKLREAGIAHGDIQHGNVLLVPGSRPGAYGLKLVDYDGMYVPSLASTPSGEAGHPNFQHPERIATRAYSADLDRFPHLVVITALKALEVLGPGLWSRYDNGDNLLFTEGDFRDPARSPVMRELWQSGHPAVQALVGRLAIACGRPIAATPWIDEVVPDGEPLPLGADEEQAVAAVLGTTSHFLPVMSRFEAQEERSSEFPSDGAGWQQEEVEEEKPESKRDYEARPRSAPQKRKSRAGTRSRIRRSRGPGLLPVAIVLSLVLAAAVAGITAFVISSRSPETAARQDRTGDIPKKEPGPATETIEPAPVVPTDGPDATAPAGDPMPPPGKRLPPSGYLPVRLDRPELELRPRWTARIRLLAALLMIDPPSETLFLGGHSSFTAFNLRTGELRPGFESLSKSHVAGIFPLDGGRVATYVRDDSELRLWTVATGQPAGRIAVPSLPESKAGPMVHLSPNGRFVVATRRISHDWTGPPVPLVVVETETRKSIIEMEWRGGTVSFTGDSSRMLVASYGGRFGWFNLPAGTRLAAGTAAEAAAFTGPARYRPTVGSSPMPEPAAFSPASARRRRRGS